MIKVAILDDYQNVSQEFVDLKKLSGKYEIKIFSEPFLNEDDAIEQLSGFEALLIMRERTPITKKLIESLKNYYPYIFDINQKYPGSASIDLNTITKKKSFYLSLIDL